MDNRLLFRYLQLESFSKEELNAIFDRIHKNGKKDHHLKKKNDVQAIPSLRQDLEQDDPQNQKKLEPEQCPPVATITHAHMRDFLLERVDELEKENGLSPDTKNNMQAKRDFAEEQATRILSVFDGSTSITQKTFRKRLLKQASSVEFSKVAPISLSMLLVGSSVGIITPVMPFVVESLGLSPGQYGMVVSAFALAKMTGNIPAAILVERHGRKPYLTYSLCFIALGVGGIGLATSFEQLWACRLLTGLGVAALSTAATMSIADMSTPRNRAQTMAPIMSCFAAGAALGPAIGGILADSLGIQSTFYAVGASYIGLTVVNHLLLNETKTTPLVFPWQEEHVQSRDDKTTESTETMLESAQNAVGQWGPLLSRPKIRNVVIMNCFYWVALAGSQMTLLPLMLTDPEGLNMTATQVGQVYMGMSCVQVLGNPIIAKGVDRIGKGPAILVGCGLLSTSMAVLPFASASGDLYQLAAVLGLWASGSTVLSTAPVAFISDHTEEDSRAQAIALLRTSGDVGFLAGATAAGALADWAGNLEVAMQTSAGILLTATTWFGLRQFLQSKLKEQS